MASGTQVSAPALAAPVAPRPATAAGDLHCGEELSVGAGDRGSGIFAAICFRPASTSKAQALAAISAEWPPAAAGLRED